VRRIAPAPDDLIFAKGVNLLTLGDYSEAEDAFREYLSYQPNHPGALLGLIRTLLFRGEGHEAAILLRNFPASSLYLTAQQLMPVARVFTERFPEDLGEDNLLEAAFLNSVRLARRGNILAAMDGLLDILRKNKHYRDDQVKDVFVGLLALIGESHPDARSYRQELSSVLF
jgi:putative thioredoxin